MSWEWIADTLLTLPGCNEELLKKLLIEKRLRFNNQEFQIDTVDICSTRLICSALDARKNLFINLPDSHAYRPAFLCAVAIVQTWLDLRFFFRKPNLHEQTILYFGATVGIREQLRGTTINNVNLAEAFRQQDLGKQTAKSVTKIKHPNTTIQADLGLPQVVTIYAPADPVSIVKKYKPEWLAIDCNDAPNLSWLDPLICFANQNNIPVIGWGHNPLSECIAQFSTCSLVFRWPTKPIRDVEYPSTSKENLKVVLYSSWNTQFSPIIMQGTSIDTLETLLHKAGQSLAKAMQHISGRLDRDAIQAHWRYLRSLETLSVPLDFYEAEVGKYWGVQSFGQLQKACQSFRDACCENYQEVTYYLEEANMYFEVAFQGIQNDGTPLWNALINICIEGMPIGKARFITFTSRARKQLFLFALLARLNITESDLSTINTWVVSLDELRHKTQMQDTSSKGQKEDNPFALLQKLRPHLLLVGLPSPLLTPKLLPVLLNDVVDVLLYSYQNVLLTRRISEWTQALEGNALQMIDVLSQLGGINRPTVPYQKDIKVNINEPVGIEIKSGRRTPVTRRDLLWQPLDPIQEATNLFAADDEIIDHTVIIERLPHNNEINFLKEEVWCEKAIKIIFDQGWEAIFAPDETVNVIITESSGQHLDTRYVRSLRQNDRIVAIPGQRRQSVYALLISRVHRHPAIELHLALINRWQEDFVIAYQQWRQHGVRNLNELLRQLQEQGSNLTSSTALRQWLWGNILCPEDAEDLYRLADVLTMNFVRQHYKRIHQAAHRLRSLHRSLSRRLNRWLNQEVVGLATGNNNEIIDAELGLTFEDFRNSLVILRVETVQMIEGPFLSSNLGRLEKKTNVK